jgi:hypothetical protein
MYHNFLKRQDIMFKLSVALKIFLLLPLQALFSILAVLIYISLDKLSRWVGYFATEPFIPAITLSLLMLGTLVS